MPNNREWNKREWDERNRRVVEDFRYFEGGCPGGYHLGARALRQKERRAKRRMQLHIETCVSALGRAGKLCLTSSNTARDCRSCSDRRTHTSPSNLQTRLTAEATMASRER